MTAKKAPRGERREPGIRLNGSKLKRGSMTARLAAGGPPPDPYGHWGAEPEHDAVNELLTQSREQRVKAMQSTAAARQIDWPACVLTLQGLPVPEAVPRLVPHLLEFRDAIGLLRSDVETGRFPMPCSPAMLIAWAETICGHVSAIPPEITDGVSREAVQASAQQLVILRAQAATSVKASGRPSQVDRDRALWDAACELMAAKERNGEHLRLAQVAEALHKNGLARPLGRSSVLRILQRVQSEEVERALLLPRAVRAAKAAGQARSRGRPSVRARNSGLLAEAAELLRAAGNQMPLKTLVRQLLARQSFQHMSPAQITRILRTESTEEELGAVDRTPKSDRSPGT